MGEKTGWSARWLALAAPLAGAFALGVLAFGGAAASYARSPRSSSGPPHARKRPRISGSPEDGRLQSVQITEGSWTGTMPISFSYQWEVCDGHACTAIPGATEPSYRATSPQVRHKLRVLVTATNSAGTTSQLSRPSKKIREGSPLNLAPPVISGNLLEGTNLSASTGTWVGTAPFAYSYQWERCSLTGGGCTPIEGATGESYTPVVADLVSRLAVVVTASNYVGKGSATSAETLPIEAVLPGDLIPPTISGLLKEGQLLTVQPGSWEGTEPISFLYQWQLCNAAGEACSKILNATGPTLPLLTSYIGDTVDVIVTAKNSAGTSSLTTQPTSLIAGIAPLDVIPPSITGGLLEGDGLKLTTGEWSGTEPISYSYAWKLCNSLGQSCAEVKGASESALSLITSYIGDTIEGVVTAKNVAGEETATTSLTGVIKGIVPANTQAPSITGGLLEGDELKLGEGKWSGTEPISYSYAWKLCNSLGQSCAEVKGASESALSLITSYIGDTIEGVVTAKNVAGEETATTSLTGVIKGIVPANTQAPSITGGLLEGDELKLGEGKWSGTEPISYSYAWKLCNSLGQSCGEIKGASESALSLITSYIGDTIEGVVTAKNVAGEETATTSLTGVIKGVAPVSVLAPSLTGGLLEGDKLKLETGEWLGSEPISYSYAWKLCNSLGQSCGEIKGASESALSLITSYIGDTIEGVVTAKNVAGEQSASTSLTGVIKGIVPANTQAPSITGGLLEGGELKLGEGKWSGTEPISYSYAWKLCNSLGQSCGEIKGASESALSLITSYIGDTIEGVVTAKNVAGEQSASTSLTGVIKGIVPANTQAPSITGGLLEGDELKLGEGKWSGTEPISYSYAWKLCNSLGQSCAEVKGASESALSLITGYIGDTIEGVVTAKNVAGEQSASTSLTGVIKGIVPANTQAPSITGGLLEGDELKLGEGKWSGTEPISYSYAWKLCNSLGQSCGEIKGASESALSLITSYIGDTIEGVVTAKNVAGEETATTSLTGIIKGIAPANKTLPSITGSLLEGQLLTAGNGTWTGTEPITFSYQWQLCNILTKACSNAADTEKTLKLGLEDVGKLLDVVVTAKNVAGSSPVTSALTGEIGL